MSIIRPTRPTVNPRDSWPDWTDDHRWETNDGGPSPTWVADRYEPSVISKSFYLGFQLGLDGETPVEPAEFPDNPADGPTNRAFLAGLADGRYTLARERDEIMGQWAADDEFERWVDAMERASDPFDLINPNEIIEARGYHPSNAYDV